MFSRLLCRLFGHKLHVVRYLDIIFGHSPRRPPLSHAGTEGFCSRCGFEWDDVTGDAMTVVEGDGRPKTLWVFGTKW